MASTKWTRYPTVFEINTWVWLTGLSQRIGMFVELGSVPPEEWDAIADFGFDAVWLMGVWERSPAGIAIASRNQGLLNDFRRTLPDYHPADNVGSPYCVRRYVVDELLGGPGGLAIAREQLAKRGMRLMLDFVPNHVAPDHPWAGQHPEYFIRGSADDLRNDSSSFVAVNGNVFACGRDPFFPAWPDVLQLNAFDAGLRQAAKDTISSIATQSDGIRCDMAMLLMNPIFGRTWGGRAGVPPSTEYWTDIIPAVKRENPDFLFMAEAYWDKEWELQQLGFDFCYDKRLYDRLEHDSPESVRLHLCADLGYQEKLVRFIENHDEPRAAATFSPEKQKAAAITIATLPGARLFHQGQFEGRKVRIPVFLGRAPTEPVDEGLCAFYKTLIKATNRPLFHDGQWRLCDRSGWADNQTSQNLFAWSWTKGEERCLIVVNLSDKAAQARVRLPWSDLPADDWQLTDTLFGASYERRGDALQSAGLYVDLGPWQCHFFECFRNHPVGLATAA